jgi:uncharacterized protein YjbI with pentapeptide repeats
VRAFWQRNADALAIEALSAVVLGGVVAGTVLAFEQHREDVRADAQQRIEDSRYAQAEVQGNLQFVREAIMAESALLPFAGLDLSGVPLVEVDLAGANFTRADLSESDISYSTLIGANLEWADLSGASLRVAMVTDATLTDANFSGADLDAAHVGGLWVSTASFRDAHLSEAVFSSTTEVFDPANFRGAYYYANYGPPEGLPDTVMKVIEERSEDRWREDFDMPG